MKTLFLTLEYPPQKGGIASYLEPLVKNAPKEIEVEVVVPKKDEHWTKTVFSLKNNADLMVISHAIPIGYVVLLNKKRYVVICHGTDILTARRSVWKRFLFRFVLKRAVLVIANSKFTAKLLEEEGIKNVKIVYPSVLVGLGSRPSTLDAKIISVGRLVPRKGFDTLIKAMPAVIKQFPNTHLTIVGSGSYFEELDRLAHELRVENFVDILTNIDDATKNELYDQASVFVLPARAEGTDVEGFGIVTLEASAHGLPVIVGNSGGAGEAVKDGITGLLVDPLDTSGLAQKIITLLTNRETAEKMGAAGKIFAKEFSPENNAANFWKIISTLNVN